MGAKLTSLEQYQAFYGGELPLYSSNPSELVEQLKTLLIDLPGVMSASVLDYLARLEIGTTDLWSWLREADHAEALRQLFGIPRSPLALPVAIELTNRAEQAFIQTRTQAGETQILLDLLIEQIKKLLIVYWQAQIETDQARLVELETTKQQLTNLTVTGVQATGERGTMLTRINDKIARLKQQLAQVNQTVTSFCQELKIGVEKTEQVIFKAGQQKANLPTLNPAQAIPA